jgi:hypothetical protein
MALTPSPNSPLPRSLPAPANPVAGRDLRLAAAFCRSRAEALQLHAALCQHLHLQPGQALLLAPQELHTPRFQRCLQGWQRLRSVAVAPQAPAATTAPRPGLLQRLCNGLFGPAALGCLPGPRLARFDRMVLARLGQGLHAVVVQAPRGEYSCRYVLAAMGEAGVAWCAEAPRRCSVA